MCGNVEVIIDLIEKYGIDPRCKGNVSYWIFVAAYIDIRMCMFIMYTLTRIAY